MSFCGLTNARVHRSREAGETASTYSFRGWSDFVRGSLIWLGRADPVQTIEQLSAADPVRETRAAVFRVLRTLPENERGYTAAELADMAEQMTGLNLTYPELREALRASEVAAQRGGEISAIRLGRCLKKTKDQIADGYKLVMDASNKKRVHWILKRV
jgi:hypothetical protein